MGSHWYGVDFRGGGEEEVEKEKRGNSESWKKKPGKNGVEKTSSKDPINARAASDTFLKNGKNVKRKRKSSPAHPSLEEKVAEPFRKKKRESDQDNKKKTKGGRGRQRD